MQRSGGGSSDDVGRSIRPKVGHEAEALHTPEAPKTAERQVASRADLDPCRERAGGVSNRQQLTGSRRIAESSCKVRRAPDVVVAFEEQRVASA